MGFARYWKFLSWSDPFFEWWIWDCFLGPSQWNQWMWVSDCHTILTGPEPSCYGSELVLGSWNVKKGLLLKAESHSWSDQLIWSRGVAVDPIGFGCEYGYYVVDVDNVLRSKIKLVLAEPERIQDGEVVEFHDLFNELCNFFK